MSSQAEQHLPIFVGSTYEDLINYRKTVGEALHRLETIVRGMEYFGSRPESPKNECLKVVASCRIYIGIFAMRYGSVDEETGKSMTQLEYEEAARLNLPSLIYLIDEDKQPVLPKFVDTGEKAELLRKLKGELKKRFIVSFFTTPEDLATRVAQDLPPLLKSVGIPVAKSLPPPQKEANHLSGAEEEILGECAKDGELHILGTAGFGSWVRSGRKDFFDRTDRAIQARYMDAFESLCNRDYVRHSSGNLCRLTGSGFEMARRIAKVRIEPTKPKNDGLGDETIKVLRLFFEAGHDLSIEQVAGTLNLKRSVADYHFDQLMERRFVRQVTAGLGDSSGSFGLTKHGREFVMENLS